MYTFLITGSFLSLFILAFSVGEFRARQRKFRETHGCLPPEFIAPRDFIFGVDFFIASIYNGLKDRFLEYSHERFQRYGPTFCRGTSLACLSIPLTPKILREFSQLDLKTFTFPEFELRR